MKNKKILVLLVIAAVFFVGAFIVTTIQEPEEEPTQEPDYRTLEKLNEFRQKLRDTREAIENGELIG